MRQGQWPDAPLEYLDFDLDDLLADADAVAIVTEERFAEVARTAATRLEPAPLVLELGPAYDAAVAHDRLVGDRVPDGDDLIFLYTGGTTGMPKGVMWRQEDFFHSTIGALMGGGVSNHATPQDVVEAAKGGGT